MKSFLCALMVAWGCVVATPALAVVWDPLPLGDPTGDQAGSHGPGFDLTAVNVAVTAGRLNLTLSFSPSIGTADLAWLNGYVQFEVDQDEATGGGSFFDNYGITEPYMAGVDYYLEFVPYSSRANLVHVRDGTEVIACVLEGSKAGRSATYSLPISQAAGDDGILLGQRLDLNVLVGNNFELTDWAPNRADSYRIQVPEPAGLCLLLAGLVMLGRGSVLGFGRR
jgi:hypothetical protein